MRFELASSEVNSVSAPAPASNKFWFQLQLVSVDTAFN
jgi:hypothetical protein